MRTLIMKFGGSSLGTPAALSQVLSIVLHEQQRTERLLLVISALDGVTDMLLEAAYLAQVSNQRGYRRIAATLRTRHLALVEQLPLGVDERTSLQVDIDRLLFEMLDICQNVSSIPTETLSPAISDKIASIGERLSARIVAGLLRQNTLRGVAIDSTDLIITDNTHGNATPNLARTAERVQEHLAPMLERQIIPVVTGFIGITPSGVITTMGRGGSDYTASILATCVNADEVWIWSDVDGMMSADPREVPEAQTIDALSYDEVAELAYFGARILHPRMIRPLQHKQIPLRVKNVFKPQKVGTLIHNVAQEAPARIKAVTSIQGISLTVPQSGDVTEVIQWANQIFNETIGNVADVMISAQSSNQTFLCFVIPTSAGMEAVDTVKQTMKDHLKAHPEHGNWAVKAMSVVTLIGDLLDESPRLLANLLIQLEGIRVFALSQAPSRCSLSLVVASQDTKNALKRLHEQLLKTE